VPDGEPEAFVYGNCGVEGWVRCAAPLRERPVNAGSHGNFAAVPALTAYIAVNAGRVSRSPALPALTACIGVNAGRVSRSPALPALTAYIAVNAGRASRSPALPALTGRSDPPLDARRTPAL
jgi:hypothetical protein